MKTVGIVSCSKQKLGRPARAKDMYCSPLFRLSRKYVEDTCDSWAIISALHCLVMPEQILAPYDLLLSRVASGVRKNWREIVRDQIVRVFGDDCRFIVLAGREYAKCLDGLANVEAPLAGMNFSERLRWLSERTKG